jgi:hypothetical protein
VLTPLVRLGLESASNTGEAEAGSAYNMPVSEKGQCPGVAGASMAEASTAVD